MDEITHEVRLQEWAKIIQAWSTSGLNKKEWCEQNGIPTRKFFYWQQKVRQELYDNLQAEGTSLPVVRPVQTPCASFAELPVPDAVAQNGLFKPDAVLKIGHITVELSNSTSAALLAQIKELVRGAV